VRLQLARQRSIIGVQNLLWSQTRQTRVHFAFLFLTLAFLSQIITKNGFKFHWVSSKSTFHWILIIFGHRKPISLISHSDVRYRGILAGIDPAASTIQLSNGECGDLFLYMQCSGVLIVYSMGTESRRYAFIYSHLPFIDDRHKTGHRLNSSLLFKNHTNT
jgi:hypothetical protein